VIPVSSNGTLDLLERSLNTGSYGDAIFQTWSTQLHNSLVAIKLAYPILKDDFKLGVELTSSVIDARAQNLGISNGTTGAANVDVAKDIKEEPKGNPSSVLFIVDVPIAAGALKVTPEVSAVLNRNFNSNTESGDNEVIGGLSASYKLSDAVSLNLSGAYGTVSNENSKVGSYGTTTRSDTNSVLSDDKKYISNGLIGGLGATCKVGPGSFAIDFKFGNSYNGADQYTFDKVTSKDSTIKVPLPEPIPGYGDEYPVVISIKKTEKDVTEDPKTLTDKKDFLFDLRYTWNAHSKFTIQPRWRVYVTTYNEGSGHVSMKMENRPELILTGSF
jgi:hypothetical protein